MSTHMVSSLVDEITRLLAFSISRNQRFMLWLTGDWDDLTDCWNHCVAGNLSSQNVLILSPARLACAPEHHQLEKTAQLKRLLGSAFDYVVYDARCGINPDVLGQLSGMINGGGGFVFLSSLPQTETFFADPEKARLTVYPYSDQEVADFFLQRLVHVFQTDNIVTHYDQAQGLVKKARLPTDPHPVPAQDATQQQVVEQLWQHAQHGMGVSVLTAARGRGKSAALGKVAQLAQRQGLSVGLTAPDKAAVSRVFTFAGPENRLTYLAPHEILGMPAYDLLLVDEAAAIPSYYLHQLVKQATHVIFATTTQGYEGSGQGFVLRFLHWLANQGVNLVHLTLTEPMRWAAGDPLETFFNRLLLLDAAVNRQQPVPQQSDLPFITYAYSAREVLARNEQDLTQLFGLLIDAHYRTTPGDLRILLDSPNMHLWLARCHGNIIAACLIAQEGRLPDALAEDIWQGVRRPRGHLTPQLLIAQAGHRAAGRYCYWRVVRIAVQNDWRRQGVAAALISQVAAQAQQQAVDFMAASFGATPALQQFWQALGYTPVRIGTQVDTASGSFSLLVVKPLHQHVEADVDYWRGFVGFQLAYGREVWMGQLANYLETDRLPDPVTPTLNWCREDVSGFCHAHRTYESVAAALKELIGHHLQHIAMLPPRQHALLMACFNHEEPDTIIKRFSLSGKRDFIACMRAAARDLLTLIVSVT